MAEQEGQRDGAMLAGAPIFGERDVLCPQCGYNLRGLTEARCPECGERFDPAEVLDPRKRLRPAGPGFGWAITRMLAHPIDFWSAPQVRGTRGPNWGLLYLWLTVSVLFAIVAFDILDKIWQQQVRVEPIRWGFNDYGSDLRDLVAGSFAFSLMAFAICVVHGLLCRAAFERARVKDPEGAAKGLVAYSAIWMLPAAPAFAGLLFWASHAPAVNVGLWLHAVGAVSLPALGVLVVSWFRTLHAGGRSIASGSAWCGLWCAVANPIWYIGALVIFAAWKNR